MGLRPLLGASAFFAVPAVLRWPALIIMITTMMIGAQPSSFKYEGKASLEFFLKQCRVRAQSYRRKELPLNNVPAWRVSSLLLTRSSLFAADVHLQVALEFCC